MARYKTFLADGSVPNGRLYAGDLNGIQDFLAKQADFTQVIDTNVVRIGDSSIMLSKFGTAEASISAALRVTAGILRGLKGVSPGPLTTAQIAALPAGQRDPGLIVYNSTAGVLQINVGTDATPIWQPVNTMNYDFVSANELTSSTTYAALTTAGPVVVVPATGSYIVEQGAYIELGNTMFGYMSYDIGGTGAVDADSVIHRGTANTGMHVSRKKLKVALTGGTVLTSKYRGSVASNVIFQDRYMMVTRVG